MKKQSIVKKLQKPVNPVISAAVIIGGLLFFISLLSLLFLSDNQKQQVKQIISSQRMLTYSPTPTPTSTKTSVTPTLLPIPIVHPAISIPPADWINNSYQYYDSNLDAIFNLPNGWSIVNDPSNAGLSMPNVTPQTIGKNGACFTDLAKFFKDFSQCPNTLGYAITITRPNIPPHERPSLVLMGVSNGFGGSCNEAVENGEMKIYDAHIAINNQPYVVTTYTTSKAFTGFPNARVHEDCYA